MASCPYRTTDPVFSFDNFPPLVPTFRSNKLVTSGSVVCLDGMDKLNSSGSRQFDAPQMVTAFGKDDAGGKVTIVDLRQESHGFINGRAVSWYAEKDWANVGLSPDAVVQGERELLDKIRDQGSVAIGQIKTDADGKPAVVTSVPVDIQTVTTEGGLAAGLGLGYQRFPVTDHAKPLDDVVELFVAFTRNFPVTSHVHFHCHGGDGRTTTFLVLYDIVRSRSIPAAALADILNRQELISGYDLTKLPAETSWKYQCAVDRIALIRNFFDYVHSTAYEQGESWSWWLASQSST
jgi:hypothetical protein